MRTSRRLALRILLTLYLLGAVRPLAAEDGDPAAAGIEGTVVPNAPRRFDSEKPLEEPRSDVKRPGIAPEGFSKDGLRGSAIAPAPGAFGTDAGSPDDLRR